VRRAGMASGTADLQRDLGGAIMQSILGALLTAGFAHAAASALASSPEKARVTSSVENQLTKSFDSAEATAKQYPHYEQAIIQGARKSFTEGDDWAYTAGIIAVLLGGTLVFLRFPRREEERRLLAAYAVEDSGATAAPASTAPTASQA
jgi:MFS transporter, DHA2 family, multidrug resistance protein